MRKLIVTLLTVLFYTNLSAQTYEVGVSLGATNYVGDVGNSTFIAPTDVGFGVVAKWNRSIRHSFRFSALYLPIQGNDFEAQDDPRKQVRGLKFKNSVKEVSLGIEFTFWEWDLHKGGKQTVPYMYTGLTAFNYGALARTNENKLKAFSNPWSMAIPIVLGVKTNLGRQMVVSFEMGARYTFTDNLDGSNPEDLSLLDRSGESLNFGNQNSNDWYFFNAITFTYTFGRKPCYCIF